MKTEPIEQHFVVRPGNGGRWEVLPGDVVPTGGSTVDFLRAAECKSAHMVGSKNLWVWVAVSWDYSGVDSWLPTAAETGVGESLPQGAADTTILPLARIFGRSVYHFTGGNPLPIAPPQEYGATVQIGYLPSPTGATKFALFLAGRHAQTDATPATGTSQIDAFRPDGTTAVSLYFGHGQLYAVEATPSGGSPTGYPRQAGRYKEVILGPSGPVTLWFLNGICVQADQ